MSTLYYSKNGLEISLSDLEAIDHTACTIAVRMDNMQYFRILIHPSRITKMLSDSQPFCLYTNIGESFTQKVVQRLTDEVKANGQSRPLLIDTMCISLLVHLRNVNGTLMPSQLLSVSEHIHSRLDGNTSIQDLCSLVRLSRYHFTRLFKRTLGITPHNYILQSKIEYAKSFMKKKKGSILDAAYRLSFSDHAHFTKTFRKFAGVTPKAFLASSCQL